MTRYAPAIVGVVLIVALTVVQIRMTDRFSGANISAEDKAALLKNVPLNIGDWKGEDKPVDERIKDTAGAVGAVSRTYRNSRTGEVVDLWLIVGHGREISAHTPDICYRASGFTARAPENSDFVYVEEGRPNTPFLTNTFFREDVSGRQLVRVFWTWYDTENEANEGKVLWEAPKNSRWHFGNTRALYKMYLTSGMRDPLETAEASPCLRFGREFLPQVEKALAQVYGDGSTTAASAPDAGAAAPAKTGIEVAETEVELEAAPVAEEPPTADAVVKESLSDEPETPSEPSTP
jgi:hypothetical protein